MDNAITEASAPPYKDRSGWLIAFGIIEILLGAFSLLSATLVIVGLLLFKPTPAAQLPPGTQLTSIVFGVGFYSLIAVFFFVAGIGSIQRRNWARILMLIVSGFWLFCGTLGAAFMLFLFPRLLEAQGNIPTEAEHVMFAITLSVLVFFGVLLPLTFLIFYSRKSVKATCLAREAASAIAAGGPTAAAGAAPRKLPIPVIILMVWEAFTAVSGLSILIVPGPATVLFGSIVRGWKAMAIMFAFSALSALTAWLIYRMRLAGWNISLLKLLFFGTSGIVSLASGGMMKLLAEMGGSPEQEQVYQLLPHFFLIMMVVTTISLAGFLALLIYSRKYFVVQETQAGS